MCCTCRFMSDQEAWTELADLYLERNKSVPVTVLLLAALSPCCCWQPCHCVAAGSSVSAMCVCAQLREGGVLSGGAAAGQPPPPPLPPALRRGLVHSTAPLTDCVLGYVYTCIVHTCRSATPRRQWKAWRLPGSTLPSQLNSTLTTCGHSTVSTWSAPGTHAPVMKGSKPSAHAQLLAHGWLLGPGHYGRWVQLACAPLIDGLGHETQDRIDVLATSHRLAA